MLRNAARPGVSRNVPTRDASSYEAKGNGLLLAAPKQFASFLVTSSSGAKLRLTDLKIAFKGSAKVDHEVKERRDGSLLVKYISHMSGDVIINLAYGKTTVSGSPFRVKCMPPKADPENSTVTLLQEHAFIDDVVKAGVRTVDQFGESCPAEGGVTAQVLDAQTEKVLFDARIVETGNGVYEASFTPEMAGLYGLNVLLGGVSIRGCPLRLKVLADETLAKNCRCFGSGMSQAVAGAPTSFTIQAVDGRGVARKSGGDVFDINIEGPEFDAPHATIRDNAEGTYVVTWTGKYAGLYSIKVALDSQGVGGTPFNCKVLPTGIDPAACDVQANSATMVRAGERAEFRIVARDSYGNIRTQGGDEFDVMIRMTEGAGQTEVKATVTEESKGFYKAGFVVKHTGIYEVNVTGEGGKTIKGVPFKCEVAPGKPDFTKCKLGGQGLQAVRLGQPCDVLIELYDVFSNRIVSALDALSDVQVTVDGPSRTSVNPAGMKQGAACFQYVAMHAGVYTISATIDGRHITNSPATVTASIAKPAAPNCEVLTNTTELTLQAGKELNILFVAKDKSGVRKSVGGDLFNVFWRSASDKTSQTSVARVTDVGTGEYTAMFNETSQGAYSVSIMYEDRHIAGSPLTVKVMSGDLEPNRTTVSGGGLTECIARRESTIQVLAKDLYGNPVIGALNVGPGEIEATLRGPETIDLTPVKREAGCLTLGYTAMKAGLYDLSITHDGRHVNGSPWKVRASPGPAVASMCTVEGLPSSVIAGHPFQFALQTLDECKNATTSTNSVTCEVDSPADGIVPLEVQELGNGAYKVSGSLRGASTALLRLLVNGAQVQQAPMLTIVPGAAASVAWINNSTLAGGLTVSAGEEGFAELACLDAYGNRLTSVAVGISAELKHEGGQAPAVTCRIAPLQDGIVRTCFRPEKAGPYSLIVKLDPSQGAAVARPATLTQTVTCVAGPMDIAKSRIERSDSSVVAGRTGTLSITCCDIFGNPTCNVPIIPLTLVPSGKLKVWWNRPAKSSTLTLYYSNSQAGTCSLDVTAPQGGAPIEGSPVQIAIKPDSASAARCTAVARSNKRVMTAETGTLTAGEKLEVELSMADINANTIKDIKSFNNVSVVAVAVTGAAVPLQPQIPGHTSFPVATPPASPGEMPGSPTAAVAAPAPAAKDYEDESLVFAAIMEKAGLYSLQVMVGGSMLANWHMPISVIPGKADARHCSIKARGAAASTVRVPVVGQPLACILSTADAHGNVRHSGGATVSPVVIRPDGEETSKAKVKDLTDGRYMISFTPEESGEYVVSALVNGEEILQDQELQATVAVPPLTVDMCALYVPEQARVVPAGSSFYITVEPPENTESKPEDGAKCLVHLQDPDNGMTLFDAQWDAQQVAFVADVFVGVVGGNVVWATLDGERVGGKDHHVSIMVEPNCIELNASDLSGGGLEQCQAGEQAEVLLTPRDALGNPNASFSMGGENQGQLSVRVMVEDSDAEQTTALMTPDVAKSGRLKATYMIKRAGDVYLTVQLVEPDGGVLQQRSFALQCLPGKPSPAHYELLWANKPLIAGQSAFMEVVCRDAYSNPLVNLPGAELWSVFLQQSGSQVGRVNMQPLPHSRYGFDVLCKEAGPTQLCFSFAGVTLFSLPVPLTVQPAEVDVKSCVAEFVGKTRNFDAGAAISVKVSLRDALGNAIPSTSDKHDVQIYLAPGKSESVILDNHSAGWQRFEMNADDTGSITLTKAATYIVHVTVDGETLPTWPRPVTVSAGPPDAKQCTVAVPRTRSLRCRAPSTLTLVARDTEGNTCTKGGARVEVTAKAVGSVQPGQVVDNGNGTYALNLELDVEGDWEITAMVEGTPVSGMPIKVHAAYDPITAAECEVADGFDTKAPLTAGASTQIVIQAKGVDKTRRMFTGGEAINVVSTNSIGHEVPIPVGLDQNGLRATAMLTPFVPGPLSVAINIGGEPIPSSPLVLHVEPGKVSARHCTVIPVTKDYAAETTQKLPKGALVIAKGGDMLGNAAPLEEHDVEVTFQPPEAVSAIAEVALPDGSVCVCGVVQHEANAFVSVLGSKVHTAPIRLVPVTADAARLRAVHLPDHVPVAGETLEVIVQASDASGAVLDMEDLKVVAEMVLKSERAMRDMAQTPLMSSRLRTSENGLSMLPENSTMGGGPTSPTVGGPTTPALQRPGRTTTDSMMGDDSMMGTPSMMGGAAPVGTPIQQRVVEVAVENTGPGMFRLTATPDAGGSYMMRAAVGSLGPDSGFLQLPIEVRAGTLSPENCTVTPEEKTCSKWVAGGTARLTVRLADRFGNPVHDVDASQLDVQCTGPGKVSHSTVYGPRGHSTIVVRLTGRAAGRYEVAVRDRITGNPLGGPPVHLTLLPADLNPRMSSFHIRGWEVTGGRPTVSAGADMQLTLAIYDIFGNAGRVREENIVAHASGPGGVVSARPSRTPSQEGQEKAATASAGDSGANSGAASDDVVDVHIPMTLTRAGQYRLTVEIRNTDGQVVRLPPFQGHEAVTVVPANADPIKTIIESWPPDSAIATGSSHNMTIVPCDAYGNPGGTGATFTVRLLYGGSNQVTPCTVVPGAAESGKLVATVVPKDVGTPSLQVLCTPAAAVGSSANPAKNGQNGDAAAAAAAKSSQTYLIATKELRIEAAGTSAAQCFLSNCFPEQGGVVGMPVGMQITACDAQGNKRKEGSDRFTVDIPGLPKHAVQLTDRGDGTYSLQFVPTHEGTASVHVMLDGTHVRGSPMAVSVHRDVDSLARGALSGKLATAVTGLRRGLTTARTMHHSLRSEAEGLQQYVPVLVQSAASELGKLLAEQQALLKEARESVNREGSERRRLHNLVQELRGNIRVYVRVKPLTQDEIASGITPVLRCTAEGSRIECLSANSTKAFDFDHVFSPKSTQAEVFGEVAGLITSVLDGYNVCVFAYGQTGSGKTHTMEGPPEDPGINFRAMKELFRVMITERRASHKHEINASIVEIYNEQVRDLLAFQEEGEELVAMELHKTPTGFSIPGLTKVPVTSAEQITDVMSRGYENRCVAAHDINAHSSRSHALLIVEVTSTNIATGIRTVGKLTLCDLAGSERVNKTGASGLTLVEAQNINKSLLELGNVMSALMAQAAHVPYRNSKLTMILQDSLGGDAKALMFCNLAPQPLHVSETLSSLAFASKVSSVVLKTPLRRVEEVNNRDDDSGDPYAAPSGGTPSQTGEGRPPIGLTTPTASSAAKGAASKVTPRSRTSSAR